MTNPIGICNGRVVPQHELSLPIHDAGLVGGVTVTDLCRTVRHRLYRWADHLARFRQSCGTTAVPLRPDDAELTRQAEVVVGHNAALLSPDDDLALVLIATPGPVGFYLGQSGGLGSGEPTLVLHTFPLPLTRYRGYHQRGARLVVPSVRHVPPECVDPRVKQRSRLHWYLAECEARRADPDAAALLLDLHGQVTETAAANLLLVKGGRVLSPPRHAVLGGVSLAVVRELCGLLALPYEERPLTVYDCLTADEAMLTCTSFCLAGVSHVNGRPVPWPGPVFERLLAAWGDAIGLDIRGQILGRDGT